MSRKNLFVLLLVLAILLPQVSFALDIPIDGAGGGGSAIKIGYVDMERIFQLYPKTQDAKLDYSKQLQAKRSELAKKEAELNAVKSKLAVLESTLKNGTAAPDPASNTSSTTTDEAQLDPNMENAEAQEPQSMTALKKDLQNKIADFEEQKKRSQDDLLAFERKQSQVILGNIYQALRDLSQEEQITIVVDKSSILYGAADIDLTEKLQNKVRGY